MKRTAYILSLAVCAGWACSKAEPTPSSTTAPATTTTIASATDIPAASVAPAVSQVPGERHYFHEIVGRAKIVRITGPKSVELKVEKDIQGVIDALGGLQLVTKTPPSCIPDITIRFHDEQGTLLGNVGLCDSDAGTTARLEVPGGTPGGFDIKDKNALRSLFVPLGIKLH